MKNDNDLNNLRNRFVFLDDIREPEEVFDYTNNQLYLLNWIIVRNYNEFIKETLKNGLANTYSFDHDLGYEHYEFTGTYSIPYSIYKEKTGYDCAKWLIEYCIDNKLKLPETILIHSMNRAGAANIKSLFDTYNKVKNL